MTAMPHPNVMTIQPEFWALEWFNSTAATTPSPMRIRIAVPMISAPMMLKRNSSLLVCGRTGTPARPRGRPYSRRSPQVNVPPARARGLSGADVPVEEVPRLLAGADAGHAIRLGGRRHRARGGGPAGRRDALLGVEPGLDASHRLVAVLAGERADRRAEAHADRLPEEAAGAEALGPAHARRHRLARAVDEDRQDGHVVGGGEDRGARVQLAARAVARAGALRVEEEVPALADEAVQVVRGALLHAAALAGDRHGAEEQGHGRRDPALAIEVVGRRGHGGALAPRARKRAQDRRRVHVARVVGDEDDRRARGAEYLAALDPAADVPGHHRPEKAREDRLPCEARGRAPRPRHVERRALDLTPALARRRSRPRDALLGGVTRTLMGGP